MDTETPRRDAVARLNERVAQLERSRPTWFWYAVLALVVLVDVLLRALA